MKRPLRTDMKKKSLMAMGVPRKFCDKTLKDFDTFGDKGLKKVKEFVTSYLTELHTNVEDGNGIFFYGSNGVGKSLLACIILKEMYRNRLSCRRVTFSNYMTLYTESWGIKDSKEKYSNDRDFYETYKGVEFLVLEEIGKEIDSKIAKPILEDLMRYREEQGLITIICSNSPLPVIEDVYGKSVASLIKGSMTPVKIVGEDRRY